MGDKIEQNPGIWRYQATKVCWSKVIGLSLRKLHFDENSNVSTEFGPWHHRRGVLERARLPVELGKRILPSSARRGRNGRLKTVPAFQSPRGTDNGPELEHGRGRREVALHRLRR